MKTLCPVTCGRLNGRTVEEWGEVLAGLDRVEDRKVLLLCLADELPDERKAGALRSMSLRGPGLSPDVPVSVGYSATWVSESYEGFCSYPRFATCMIPNFLFVLLPYGQQTGYCSWNYAHSADAWADLLRVLALPAPLSRFSARPWPEWRIE